MALIPPDPSLSETQRQAWEEAQKKLQFSKNPPLVTAQTTSGGSSFGNLKRIEMSTPVKAPQDNTTKKNFLK